MFYGDMLGRKWRLWDIATLRDKKKLPVVLDVEEVKPILGNVALMRHRVALRLMYCCGLRLDELVHLTVDDIESDHVIVRDGKGGKDRRVPLPPAMYRQLRWYWSQHRNPRWLFPSPGRGASVDARQAMGASTLPMGKGALSLALRKAVEKTGVRKKVTAHTLRHSYAPHLLDAGLNLRQLQLYLGHEDIQTTTLYTHRTSFGEERGMAHVEALDRMAR